MHTVGRATAIQINFIVAVVFTDLGAFGESLGITGSRAATLVTAEGVPQEVIDGFAIAGPMTVGGGDTPASTLWWDGWTVAKNISEGSPFFERMKLYNLLCGYQSN